MSRKSKKQKKEFSKALLLQESILIWIITIAFLILAFISVLRDSTSELPWLTAMAGFPWTAYGVSQAFYYMKAKAENTKDGIKFETMVLEKALNDELWGTEEIEDSGEIDSEEVTG